MVSFPDHFEIHKVATKLFADFKETARHSCDASKIMNLDIRAACPVLVIPSVSELMSLSIDAGDYEANEVNFGVLKSDPTTFAVSFEKENVVTTIINGVNIGNWNSFNGVVFDNSSNTVVMNGRGIVISGSSNVVISNGSVGSVPEKKVPRVILAVPQSLNLSLCMMRRGVFVAMVPFNEVVADLRGESRSVFAAKRLGFKTKSEAQVEAVVESGAVAGELSGESRMKLVGTLASLSVDLSGDTVLQMRANVAGEGEIQAKGEAHVDASGTFGSLRLDASSDAVITASSAITRGAIIDASGEAHLDLSGNIGGGAVIKATGDAVLKIAGHIKGSVSVKTSRDAEVRTNGAVGGDYAAAASGDSVIIHRNQIGGSTMQKCKGDARISLG